jgi:hypothetical protein
MLPQFTQVVSDSNGVHHTFAVYPSTVSFNSVGAIYALLHVPNWQIFQGHFLYIGKAKDLDKRIKEHRGSEGTCKRALEYGYNAIGAFAVANETDRQRVERDLIQRFKPPLNTQHASGLGNGLADVLRGMTHGAQSNQGLGAVRISVAESLMNGSNLGAFGGLRGNR